MQVKKELKERNVDPFSLLHKKIREGLRELGLVEATEPQRKAIPCILNGKNVLLISPTGSGKTEAALLPVFSLYLNEKEKKAVKPISILYITPLRALNRDIFRRVINLAESLGIRVEIRHGDTTPSVRRRQSLHPPDMLITTPETLQAILPGARLREWLKNVRWVIVDEIHELVTEKRGVQLAIALERLKELTKREFQRIGLSATIGSPEVVGRFLVGNGRHVEIVRVPIVKEFELKVLCPSPQAEDVNISKKIFSTPETAARIRVLVELLKMSQSVLTFVNTREIAEILASRLHLYDPSLSVDVHHGSLGRDIRIEVERLFKDGKLKCIICTSSMELGIDIGTVDLVVQYMSPRQVTRLVQRVGRSGHRVGRVSRGVIIALDDMDDILESAVIAFKTVREKLEPIIIHEKAFDVLCHQIAGIVLDKGNITVNDLFNIVKRVFPYRNLNKEELLKLLELMNYLGIIRVVENVVVKKTRKTRRYYYESISTIPDVRKFEVVDSATKKKIGTLDEKFVIKHGDINTTFIMKGSAWKILQINEGKVFVSCVDDPKGAIPSWEGEQIPVLYYVASEVGKIRGKIAEAMKSGRSPLPFLLNDLFLDIEAAQKVEETLKKQLDRGIPVPTDRLMLIEVLDDVLVIHACFGNLVNETLGRVLAALLSARLGIDISLNVDPYRIILKTSAKISPRDILDILEREIGVKNLESLLKVVLRNSSLLAWRMFHVARRFGVISRDVDFNLHLAWRLLDAYRDTLIFEEAVRETLITDFNIILAKKVLNNIRRGKIALVVKSLTDPSPIALNALTRFYPSDYVLMGKPKVELARIVKERLLNERVRLVCMNCVSWETVRTIKTLPDRVECPKCGSVLIGITYPHQTNITKVLKKYKFGQKLTADEEKIVKKLWKTANLLVASGKQALIVLAARGVGPEIAAKILSKKYDDENDFYIEILNAEREYIRTRAFWD